MSQLTGRLSFEDIEMGRFLLHVGEETYQLFVKPVLRASLLALVGKDVTVAGQDTEITADPTDFQPFTVTEIQ